jgi:hypothetical protein
VSQDCIEILKRSQELKTPSDVKLLLPTVITTITIIIAMLVDAPEDTVTAVISGSEELLAKTKNVPRSMIKRLYYMFTSGIEHYCLKLADFKVSSTRASASSIELMSVRRTRFLLPRINLLAYSSTSDEWERFVEDPIICLRLFRMRVYRLLLRNANTTNVVLEVWRPWNRYHLVSDRVEVDLVSLCHEDPVFEWIFTSIKLVGTMDHVIISVSLLLLRLISVDCNSCAAPIHLLAFMSMCLGDHHNGSCVTTVNGVDPSAQRSGSDKKKDKKMMQHGLYIWPLIELCVQHYNWATEACLVDDQFASESSEAPSNASFPVKLLRYSLFSTFFDCFENCEFALRSCADAQIHGCEDAEFTESSHGELYVLNTAKQIVDKILLGNIDVDTLAMDKVTQLSAILVTMQELYPV